VNEQENITDKRVIRIGGASGFWGDSDLALPQLLAAGGLDYIVFDYLAEITMSIMARSRAKDPKLGYAVDFVEAIKNNIHKIAKAGVKIISNAGGVNARACGDAIQGLIKEAGLELKVATITGDDLSDRAAEFTEYKEMFSCTAFPGPDKVASINAYLGAFPIATALERGADIVITGRCVDSAVTLGACIHEFSLTPDDLDALAGASLAGHIIECGPQATGGNFTDWEETESGLADVGHPIVEITQDGAFDVVMPEGTGGMVTTATVGEQMVYEIGDPQAYILPDVVCDFSDVTLVQAGENRVCVTGAKGFPAPNTYKVSATFEDGWKITTLWFYIGEDASKKALSFARSALIRASRKLRALNFDDYDVTAVETFGDESHYGAYRSIDNAREVALKLAVKHQSREACFVLLKEATGLALAAPPGLALYAGGRPKPSPIIRLFSFLLPKNGVSVTVDIEGEKIDHIAEAGVKFDPSEIVRADAPVTKQDLDLAEAPLIKFARARSGDKGNKANIGVIPRQIEHAPWIWASLNEEEIARRFAHFTDKSAADQPVERFFMPGTGAMNIVLHDVLGGGGMASLRNDPQGKSYAQILLQTPVRAPRAIIEAL